MLSKAYSTLHTLPLSLEIFQALKNKSKSTAAILNYRPSRKRILMSHFTRQRNAMLPRMHLSGSCSL